MGHMRHKTHGLGGPNDDQHGHKLEHDSRGRLNEPAHCRIRLTGPCTEGGMRDVRLMVVVRKIRLFRMSKETPGDTDRQSQIEGRHADRERDEDSFHFLPLSTCCISARASGLSHARGPTARPTCVPSGARSTVVGKPRTMNIRDTS